jgi:hypothetical protein
VILVPSAFAVPSARGTEPVRGAAR